MSFVGFRWKQLKRVSELIVFKFFANFSIEMIALLIWFALSYDMSIIHNISGN